MPSVLMPIVLEPRPIVLEAFYAKLEEKFDSCPQRDVKIVIGDLNARRREEMYELVIGP